MHFDNEVENPVIDGAAEVTLDACHRLESLRAKLSTTALDGFAVRGLTSEKQPAQGVRGGVRVEKSVGSAVFAGIEPGDIILMVDNTPVSGPRQFHDKVESSGHALALLVERSGRTDVRDHRHGLAATGRAYIAPPHRSWTPK
ncbi:PDZ domain-containing protein [Paraburkholderia bannensis]|uniref:PDZ domain-containing protein n=1 Tax=Paraburkholderia bannensis TaxID=765414 RepID=UPI0012EB3A00|nr:PDZ domain-containing protein [Paraburkholderia bannensis]